MTYQPQPAKKLVRTPDDKVISGVCGGLARYLNMDPTLVRVLVVILTFFTAVPLVIYVVLWLVLPEGEGGVTGMDTVSTAFGNSPSHAPQYPNTNAPQYGHQPPTGPQYGPGPSAPPQYAQQPPTAPDSGAPMASENPGYPLYNDDARNAAKSETDWASTPYSPPTTPPEAPAEEPTVEDPKPTEAEQTDDSDEDTENKL